MCVPRPSADLFPPGESLPYSAGGPGHPTRQSGVLVRGDKPFDLRQHAFIFLVGNMAALVQPGVQADLHRLIRRAFLPARDAVQRRYLSGRRQQGKTGHDALHLVSSVVRHQGVLVAAK